MFSIWNFSSLTALENVRRELIWRFWSVFFTLMVLCPKLWYKKRPAISFTAVFKFRLNVCTKAMFLLSLILCQIYLELCALCVFLNEENSPYDNQLWLPYLMKLHQVQSLGLVTQSEFGRAKNLTASSLNNSTGDWQVIKIYFYLLDYRRH